MNKKFLLTVAVLASASLLLSGCFFRARGHERVIVRLSDASVPHTVVDKAQVVPVSQPAPVAVRSIDIINAAP